MIIDNVTNYLETENLINCGQHGFRRSRSCLSQVLSHYQNYLTMMEEGDIVDVVYLDFAKVDYGILLQ